MPRMYPVNGTKERRSGRRAYTFTIARTNTVLLDGIDPHDRDAAFALLWQVYGTGNVWSQSRRMATGETYVELAEIGAAA